MSSTRKPLTLPPGSDYRTPEFEHFIRRLWPGSFCHQSHGTHDACSTNICTSKAVERLRRYYDFFEQICRTFDVPEDCHALRSHEDLLDLIDVLRQNPDVSKDGVTKLCFESRDALSAATDNGKERAIEVAARLMTMMQSRTVVGSFDSIELDHPLPGWTKEKTLSQFVHGTWPHLSHGKRDHETADATSELIESTLTASALSKRAGVIFEGTDDIRNHLRLDVSSGTVQIFHHVGLLKEMLRLTKKEMDMVTVEDHLRHGVLPRDLALEVVDSIQEVLFPLSDTKSQALLRSLTVRKRFDPECLDIEHSSIRRDDERKTSYVCFGARLADLYEEMENPTPRGKWNLWLQRKSGARYVMLATLIGVVFAVILGMASLAVSSYQAYIGYQVGSIPSAPVVALRSVSSTDVNFRSA